MTESKDSEVTYIEKPFVVTAYKTTKVEHIQRPSGISIPVGPNRMVIVNPFTGFKEAMSIKEFEARFEKVEDQKKRKPRKPKDSPDKSTPVDNQSEGEQTMASEDQEPVDVGASEEESQENELENAELENESATDSVEENDTGASEEESQPVATEDDSLSSEDSSTQIDYEAKISELESKYEQEHKARSGWDNKYRELLDEHKTLKQQLEEKVRREQELQQAESTPMWDRRSPRYNEFMSKVPQIEMMKDLATRLGNNEEAIGALSGYLSEAIPQEYVDAYRGFQEQKQLTASKLASGDYSPLMEQMREEARNEVSQYHQKIALEQRTKSILDDPQNMAIYKSHQAEVESLLQSGIDMEVAFKTIRNQSALSEAEQKLAEFQAREAEIKAKNAALKKKSVPPVSGVQNSASIDSDAIWNRAVKLAKERHGESVSADQVTAIHIDLVDEAIAQL